ncbi:MAG: AHH domain-containing protein [Gammaproteobacteria bacterium]|nr:AHH domain-containing protein [Gammaproteobacteria bacterium]MDH5651276.1 AHH domain-containing protein [Gammaproteobacteria bacterium]
MSGPDMSDRVRDTHLKTPLQHIEEAAIKRAEELDNEIIKAKENGDDLSHKAFVFMISETARLKNIAALQVKLDSYRRSSSDMTLIDRNVEAAKTDNSKTLGENLIAYGKFKTNEYFEAHHIVCSRHSSHASSRFILLRNYKLTDEEKRELGNDPYLEYSYRINDPDNGCWLPKKHKYAQGTPYSNAVGHHYIHTNKYANWVHNTLLNSRSKKVVQGRLLIIEMKLLSMTWEKAQEILTKKGQDDFRTKT